MLSLLAERGVDLSTAQVYRMAARVPERISLPTLAALCDIFSCTPADLIGVAAGFRPGPARASRPHRSGRPAAAPAGPGRPEPGTAPAKRVECARCHRAQRACQTWPEGPVCRTCLRHAVQRRGPCAGCGVDRLLPGRDGKGAGLCVDCAAIPRSFLCATCGAEGQQWFSATCLACSLQRRLAALLDDGTGQVTPALVPLVELITSTGRPGHG